MIFLPFPQLLPSYCIPDFVWISTLLNSVTCFKGERMLTGQVTHAVDLDQHVRQANEPRAEVS